MKPRSVITTTDLSQAEIADLLALAQRGKMSNWREFSTALAHKVIALMFFNPSLRTRASFQSGIARLGGQSVILSPGNDSWTLEFEEGALMYRDRTEHVKDAAQVLSQYFDAVCIRAFPAMRSWEEDVKDPIVTSFARHLEVPFISMESALWHPCQALADALTLHETFKEDLRGKKFVLTWAPHPKQLPLAVPHSTALMAAQLGMAVTLACPDGYEFAPEISAQIDQAARASGGSFRSHPVQAQACEGAHVIYAKSWSPPPFLGRRELELEHRKALPSWMVDEELMAEGNNPYFMHCLPVRRNIEVEDEVVDSPRSLTTQQAANRLHAQNALLLHLIGRQK